MVSDEPRLPGVQAPGWLWHEFRQRRREGGSCVPSGSDFGLIASSPTREERSRCATRGLEPFSRKAQARSPGRYEDPLSGTDFLVAAWPARRLAAWRPPGGDT
jgi:hypothetical protein